MKITRIDAFEMNLEECAVMKKYKLGSTKGVGEKRIYVGHDKHLNTTIVLSDYDNNGNKSGEVITTYGNLLYILSRPLEDQYILKKAN
jgi:hypothetical protein